MKVSFFSGVSKLILLYQCLIVCVCVCVCVFLFGVQLNLAGTRLRETSHFIVTWIPKVIYHTVQ
jgi:hypothetical protein